jgi:hypothetical protein
MYPFIGNVFTGNIIPKPFVSAFMYDDEIPFQPPACFSPVLSMVSPHKIIAVGDITLMFHAEVR